jgi:CRP-like cAMP-binding protein
MSIDLHTRTSLQRAYSIDSEDARRDQIMRAFQSYQEAPAFVQMPVKTADQRIVRRRRVRKGGHIFAESTPSANTYMVASGEVLIFRDGQPVDLVEAGELLDPRIWSDATAIARTDCILAPRPADA